jgi:hypothetical protein
MLINMPTGKHRLRLVFRDTPVRVVGKLISLGTAMVLIIILAVMGTGAETRPCNSLLDKQPFA